MSVKTRKSAADSLSPAALKHRTRTVAVAGGATLEVNFGSSAFTHTPPKMFDGVMVRPCTWCPALLGGATCLQLLEQRSPNAGLAQPGLSGAGSSGCSCRGWSRTYTIYVPGGTSANATDATDAVIRQPVWGSWIAPG